MREALRPTLDGKQMFVWDGTDFSLVMSIESNAIYDNTAICTINKFCGFPIQVDRSLPSGTVEFRATDGRLLGRVVNVGVERNEMG